MNEQELERLERYVDGELPPDEAAEVERHLEEIPAWADARADLIGVGALLRERVEAGVDAADFSDFFARVEAGLAAEPAPVPAAAPRDAATPPAESPWSRLRAWWSRNWTPVLVSAAAAAAVAFWISRGAGPGAADAPDNAGPIAIDSVSNEGNKTVLISMPAEDGGATVIWLLDEESDDGQPVDGEDPI